MTSKSPWILATKANGYALHQYGDRFDIHFRQAVQEIADEENAKYKPSIGATTVLWNLVIAQGPEANDLRRRIRARMKQLKKESKRHAHQARQIREDREVRL
jgi:hypothetical protein